MKPPKPIVATAVAFAGVLVAILIGADRAAAQPNAITDRYLTTVQTDLNGSLDTRKAVVGQQVTVTVRRDTRLADDTELPKGTRLVGHITQVQAQDDEHVGAVLAINFDQAELKGGKAVPVRSVIQGLTPVKQPGSPGIGAQTPQYGPTGGGGEASTATRGGLGTGIGGGGLGDGGTGLGPGGVGGLGGGPVLGGAQRSAGRTGDIPGAGPAGSIPDGGVGGTGPNSTGSLNNPNLGSLPAARAGMERPVAPAGESVSTAPRRTAMPGVLLSTTATPNASGTLIAPGRNISLSSGTQITLGVIRR